MCASPDDFTAYRAADQFVDCETYSNNALKYFGFSTFDSKDCSSVDTRDPTQNLAAYLNGKSQSCCGGKPTVCHGAPEELECCSHQGPQEQEEDKCVDTPDWMNSAGLTCHGYEVESFCSNGNVTAYWASGSAWNFPESNCCACGGGSKGHALTCKDADAWTNNPDGSYGPGCDVYQN